MFGIIDVILIIIIAYFVFTGFFYGFIRTIGSLIGLFIGLFVASQAIVWLNSQFGIFSKPLLTVFLFILIVMLIGWIVGWIVQLIEGFRKILTIIPFLGTINKLLGGILGFIEGILVIASIAYFASFYLPEGSIKNLILESPIIDLLSFMTVAVKWLFPAIPI